MIQIFKFNLPLALRAGNSVVNVIAQMACEKANAPASPAPADQPETLRVCREGERIMCLRYRYHITGQDLGLQNYCDLSLHHRKGLE